MRAGDIDMVVVGADRIAANGDTANKIGTYTVAVLAHEHKIPFYVAAPLSTIDLATPDGDHIPIEERDQREVSHLGAARLTPVGALHPQPRVRRDPEPLHYRHHHRARHLQAALHGVVAARIPDPRSHPVNGPVLAIETSCDETAAAVLAETSDASRPWAILSSVVASQADIHRGWGGVVPELASRQHVRDICGVVDAALEQAQVSAADLSSRRGHPGAGSRGVAPRWRRVREVLCLGPGPARHSGSPSRRAHRIAGARARRAAAAVGRAGGFRGAHEPVLHPGGRALSARRAHARRRGGGGVRQGGEASRARVPGRSRYRSRRARRQRPGLQLPDRAADARGSQRAAADGAGGDAAR